MMKSTVVICSGILLFAAGCETTKESASQAGKDLDNFPGAVEHAGGEVGGEFKKEGSEVGSSNSSSSK